MDSIRLKARAKINLGLDVTGIREDGYHEVKMVMQTVGLYDRIIIEKTKEPGIVITSPVRTTIKPAPAAMRQLRIVILKPLGRPKSAGSSEKEYWVLAMQIGRLP